MRRQHKSPETRYGWWRFDHYEIQNSVIRPAPGARLSWYDPWADFQKIRSQTNGQPAYVDLARLVEVLRKDPATKGSITGLSPDSRSKILAWCDQHGLLGVLLARWVSVTLAPQALGRDPTLRTQVRYSRAYGTIVGVRQTKGDEPAARSGILLHALNDVNVTKEALGDTWYRFFPSVPERERENFPLSGSF